MVDVWKWTPMITLIVLAGLKSLPQDPYEAARIDGANPLQIFWYITLPLIRPVLIAALMLRSLDNLKEFDMIYTITQGGPGIASETLYLYSYNVSFGFFKAGYGSALMVVVFLVVLVFNVLMNRLRRDASVGLIRSRTWPATRIGQNAEDDPVLRGRHRAVRAAAVRLRLDDPDRPQDRRAEHLLPAGVHLHADAGEFPRGVRAVQFLPLPDEQPHHRHAGHSHLAGARTAGGLFHRQVPAGKDRHPDPDRPDDAVRELSAALVHHLPLPEADRHATPP